MIEVRFLVGAQQGCASKRVADPTRVEESNAGAMSSEHARQRGGAQSEPGVVCRPRAKARDAGDSSWEHTSKASGSVTYMPTCPCHVNFPIGKFT
jgi:hypothetical protein